MGFFNWLSKFDEDHLWTEHEKYPPLIYTMVHHCDCGTKNKIVLKSRNVPFQINCKKCKQIFTIESINTSLLVTISSADKMSVPFFCSTDVPENPGD